MLGLECIKCGKTLPDRCFSYLDIYLVYKEQLSLPSRPGFICNDCLVKMDIGESSNYFAQLDMDFARIHDYESHKQRYGLD